MSGVWYTCQMITLELDEVTPRIPSGDLKFFIGDSLYVIFYYNKDPYKALQSSPGYLSIPESYPSYLIKGENCWYYGTYTELKDKLRKDK